MISLTPTTASKRNKPRFMPLLLLSALLLPLTGAEAAANKRPTVKITKIPATNEQTQVTLTGTGSDADGVIANYQWTQTSGPSVSLASNSTAQTAFTTPTVTKLTRVVFALKVTDDRNATATAKITVVVKPVNAPPAADAGADKSAALGTTVQLDGSNSRDSDGQISVWFWQQVSGPKVKLIGAKTSTASFITPSKLTGKLTSSPLKFRLSVTDNEKRKVSDDITVTLQKNPAISAVLDSQDFTDNSVIKAGETKTLTWILKNTGNIDLNNATLTPGTATGSLSITPTTPSQLGNITVGQSKSFSATVSAPANVTAGSHSQSWTLTYANGTPLSLTNGAIGFNLNTENLPSISANIESKDFNDGEALSRGVPKTLTWVIKNTSDIDLSNIALTPGTATGSLTIGNINPATLSSWPKGTSQAFSVVVTAPADAPEGLHSQSWALTYDNGKTLPFSSADSGIKFSLATLSTTDNVSLNLDSKNFTDSEVLARNTSKTLNWSITNNSTVDLSNVQLTPGTATGGLSIGTISPSSIDNWPKGVSKTFSVAVTAPNGVNAGTHTQSWGLTYGTNKPTGFTGLKFNLATVAANPSVSLENQSFANNDVIVRESNGTINRTITWTLKNTGDIDLENVALTPGTATGSLTIGTISPATLATWAKGTSQTFTVALTASSTIGAGTHSQSWSLSYKNGAVPFADGNSLGFILQTSSAGQCTSNTAQSAPIALAATLPYTKISADGTKLSSSISQWSCVQANNTKLMWEIKTDDNGLHDKDWIYSWYQPDSGQTGNNIGTPNAGICGNNNHNCDTESFVQAVNNQGLCGYHDWRMPTDQELLGLLSKTETEPAINGNFFPLTQQSMYWSSTSAEDGQSAWYVSFGKGYHGQNLKASPRYVRLVRDVK